VVTAFEPQGKEVWLTIDDGPDLEDTPAILTALTAHNAKATFFMIGERSAQHPELVDQVLAGGHSIGSHTQTHPMRMYWAASRKQVQRELDDSLTALNREGARIDLYRSPVGIKNFFLRRALIERGLQCVAWTIRSGDALSASVEDVLDHVEKELRPGSIILMHEGCTMHPVVRVEAIGAVLAMLSEKGYRCVLPKHERYIT
jgi:peptidoglycan/xylan/chitin deacetylase (PgdA/CDA1 family)